MYGSYLIKVKNIKKSSVKEDFFVNIIKERDVK